MILGRKSSFLKTSEERKRLFEFLGMTVVTILLVLLSRLETRLFDLSRSLATGSELLSPIVYFGLINVNVILVLVLGWLIFRNISKLVLERRRGIIGSRLRVKLVVVLVFFAVAPTVLMFYIWSSYITDSFDTWFSNRVRDTMSQTREVGAQVYKQDQRRMESLARIALQRVRIEPVDAVYPGQLPLIDASALKGFHVEYRLDALKIFDANGRLVWASDSLDEEGELVSESVGVGPLWDFPYMSQEIDADSGTIKASFVATALDEFLTDTEQISKGAVEDEDKQDVVKGAAPIYSNLGGNLLGVVVAEERFETQILRSIEAILDDFASLRPSAQLIRLNYLIFLVVMVFIILFSATWLGFLVARAITGPLQSLAEATREVALGNYGVVLEAKSGDETGELVRSFNLMTRDLSRHKSMVEESQRRLELTNEQLDARRRYIEVVLKNINTGVLSVDYKGTITSISQAAESLLRLDTLDVHGKNIRDVLSKSLMRDFWEPIAEELAEKGHYSGQIDIEFDEESGLSLIAEGTRVRDEHRSDLGYVVVFDDATEKVRAQRVAAWREVARRIAHEIKNPITPIKLNAQRLQRRLEKVLTGEDKVVLKTCTDSILTQVDSLKNMVNEFSKFSRMPTVQTSARDINDIVQDVVSLYKMSYPGVSFCTKGLSSILPLLPVDRDQLNRVFVNLVTNSVAAVEGVEGARIEFSSSLVAEINAVRIEVCDNGSGISEKIRDRVLEPYFSTKSEGSGLGLSIVQQIVADHGGYLRISERKQGGTRVVIELPLEHDYSVQGKV